MTTLEQIVRKPTFMERIRRGIASHLAPLALAGAIAGCTPASSQSCGSDGDCPGQELCIDNVCVGSCGNDYECPGEMVCSNGFCGDSSASSGSSGNPGSSVNFGGVPVKSGTTNSSGQVFFTDEQTGEDIVINVRDELGNSLPGTDVIFHDGDGFETYQAFHPDFTPYFHVFSHNSVQDLIMGAASFVCDLYDGFSKDNSKEAARKYSDTLRRASTSNRTVRADELRAALNEKTNAIIDLADHSRVGGLVKPVLICAKKILVEIPRTIFDYYVQRYGVEDCVAYNTWLAYPSDMVRGRANISPILGISGCAETSSGPSCQNDCSTRGQTQCSSDGYITCGDYDADSCLEWSSVTRCASGEHCDSGRCVDDEPAGCDNNRYRCSNSGQCIPRNYLCDGDNDCGNGEDERNCQPECDPHASRVCNNGDVYWRDSCGSLEERAQDCNANERCDEGRCVDNEPECGPYNISQGQPVSCTDEACCAWSCNEAVDGVSNREYNGWLVIPEINDSFTINFGESYFVHRLTIFPAHNDNFAEDFSIGRMTVEVSHDNFNRDRRIVGTFTNPERGTDRVNLSDWEIAFPNHPQSSQLRLVNLEETRGGYAGIGELLIIGYRCD